MSDIEWEKPPADGRGSARSINVEFRDALMERPGEWAVMRRDTAQSYTGGLRGRPFWAGFEFTARKQENGRYTTYARYVGEVSS